MSPAIKKPADGPIDPQLAVSGVRGALRGLVAAGAVASVLALASIAGCAKPLLSPDEERSPFDRYDGIRAQYAPQYTTDEYGLRKPNLRNRLGNKD